MCGISGLLNHSNQQVDSKLIIKKIVNIQNNRGPDDNGLWESECKKVFFGHNRLSIIDLSKSGKQPFISSDGNFIITFNGEIYNFLELKKELIKKNINFKSNTDTEVIIESYKFWGLSFLNKLRGMFAFAIWDKNKKKLILARDPFGIKPLYFTQKKYIF
jgi:asparagine synthase (glutamine-hydrolysing)